MEAAIKEKQILKDFNALNKGIRLIFRGPQSPPLGVTDKTKRSTEDDYNHDGCNYNRRISAAKLPIFGLSKGERLSSASSKNVDPFPRRYF